MTKSNLKKPIKSSFHRRHRY